MICFNPRKHLNDKKVEKESKNPSEPTGVPQHFGIFYAMGFALILEGFLSACYHVCPTKQNFQFDTSFMYVIAILCFIKIYQFRHSDASTEAYKAFTGISTQSIEACFNSEKDWKFELFTNKG